MLEPVQGLWIGKELSVMEQLCIKSYLHFGHPFHLYIYDSVKNIPEGTTICDANDIIPKSQIFRAHNGSLGYFSDLFRWQLLLSNGGIWVDMDMIALKPLDFEDEYVCGEESIDKPVVGLLKFPPKTDFALHMVNRCKFPHSLQPYDGWKKKIRKIVKRICFRSGPKFTSWGEGGGPLGFKIALNYFKVPITIFKPQHFYPIHHLNWIQSFDNTYAEFPHIVKDAYCIHLWNEMIRREQNFDIISDSSKDSLFFSLLRRYELL